MAELTVLRRPNGRWHQSEINLLAHHLGAEIHTDTAYEEYLVLAQHYDASEIETQLGSKDDWTIVHVASINDARLPFEPMFLRPSL
jgi:hypothetical protein